VCEYSMSLRRVASLPTLANVRTIYFSHTTPFASNLFSSSSHLCVLTTSPCLMRATFDDHTHDIPAS
jgi:hypothetical protein